MVFNDEVPGVEVEITVQGRPLVEHHAYQCAEKDTKIIGVNVGSVSDARFLVSIKVDPCKYQHRDNSLDVSIEIDGEVFRFFMEPSTFNGKWCVCFEDESVGLISGKTYKGKPKFAQIELESDDERNDESMRAIAKSLGRISVHLRRQNIVERLKPLLSPSLESLPDIPLLRDDESSESPLPSPTCVRVVSTIPEKSLKGRMLSHSVQLDEIKQRRPKKSKPMNGTTRETYKTFHVVDDRPFASYEFIYLSKEKLQFKLLDESLEPKRGYANENFTRAHTNRNMKDGNSATNLIDQMSEADLENHIRQARGQRRR
ncbi:MAG: hypothetical protein M1831_003279 [Alyxoria varia]|nr:MAG: hypothetical protein M1831_003279 [Alyxoria varia]